MKRFVNWKVLKTTNGYSAEEAISRSNDIHLLLAQALHLINY